MALLNNGERLSRQPWKGFTSQRFQILLRKQKRGNPPPEKGKRITQHLKMQLEPAGFESVARKPACRRQNRPQIVNLPWGKPAFFVVPVAGQHTPTNLSMFRRVKFSRKGLHKLNYGGGSTHPAIQDRTFPLPSAACPVETNGIIVL